MSESVSGEFLPAESRQQGGKGLAPSPKIDLRDAHAIRRELGAVYRDMRNKRIDSADGTKLAYVLDLLRRSYETCVLQDRLEKLEGYYAQHAKPPDGS